MASGLSGDVAGHLTGEKALEAARAALPDPDLPDYDVDFSEVQGQAEAKRSWKSPRPAAITSS